MTTAPSRSTPVQQALAFDKLTKGLEPLLAALKSSLDEGALRDVEKIEAVQDGHGRGGVPDGIPTGSPMTMRGGAAASEATPQSPREQGGNMADYLALSAKLSDIGKSHNAVVEALGSVQKGHKDLVESVTGIVGALQEALGPVKKGEDEKDEDEVEKALRKARIAVRKASDDDAEDEEDTVEKAQAAVKAAGAAVSKAEDEADDDDKEEAAEKARATLRTIKGDLKKASEKRAAAKAAVAAPAAQVPPAAAEKADAATDEKIAKAVESLATALGRKVEDLSSLIKGESRGGSTVPEFAKAAKAADPATISAQIDELFEDGRIEMGAVAKSKSALARLAAAQAGRGDLDAVARELGQLPASIQTLFTPASA